MLLESKTHDKQDNQPLESQENDSKLGISKRIFKESTTNIKRFDDNHGGINDVFLSNKAQKQRKEIRKMALEKRLKYGQMIQKQVLKMHKKKT